MKAGTEQSDEGGEQADDQVRMAYGSRNVQKMHSAYEGNSCHMSALAHYVKIKEKGRRRNRRRKRDAEPERPSMPRRRKADNPTNWRQNEIRREDNYSEPPCRIGQR